MPFNVDDLELEASANCALQRRLECQLDFRDLEPCVFESFLRLRYRGLDASNGLDRVGVPMISHVTISSSSANPAGQKRELLLPACMCGCDGRESPFAPTGSRLNFV